MSGAEPDPPHVVGLAIERDGETHATFWCRWCEEAHRHDGADGDASGHRAAHCLTDRSSPYLRDGYELDVVGVADTERAVWPAAPLVGRRSLREACEKAGLPVQDALIRRLLAVDGGPKGSVVTAKLDDGSVWIFADRRWTIVRERHPRLEGKGLVRLAAALFGVSAGVAAVRMFEAVTADQLDAAGAFELADLVERWIARGGCGRRDNR